MGGKVNILKLTTLWVFFQSDTYGVKRSVEKSAVGRDADGDADT